MGLAFLAVVVVSGFVVGGWIKSYLVASDYPGRGGGEALVRIKAGSTAREVGAALRDKGVVASVQAFTEAVEERSKAGDLRPGIYRLRKEMGASHAVGLLFDPSARVQWKVTVREGLRQWETLTVLARRTGIPLRDFEEAAAKPGELGLPPYAKAGLEGFLFPATYPVEPGQDARSVLAAMVARFRQEAAHLDLERQAKALNLDPLEAVTVASLAQAEGGGDADYPKIARVIYNRLRGGQRLELDTTVLYAQGRHDLRVSESDTRVRSPYNTYTNDGLPPGPVANPGEAALRAALHPAAGDWRWFVTTDPARKITKFTSSESEFVGFREELNRYLRRGR